MDNFEKVFKENDKFVFGFLYKMCQNKDLAEELTQETMYKAFVHINEFSGKCKISSWLCEIAKNEYFQYLRKGKKFVFGNQEDIQYELPIVTYKDELLERVVKKEEVRQAMDTLNKLASPYRDVFVERVLIALEYSEISRLHKKSESWCRTTYYRARMQLIERMKEL